MPSSRPDTIPAILYLLMDMRPKTILDIGAGHGKWGALAGEYLKYWCGIEPMVDGIEVHEGYRSQAWNCYRSVSVGNVVDQLERVGGYDLVLAIDVIEHLSRTDGARLIDAITGRYIIGTPGYWSAQGAQFGNPHEEHISRWGGSDFTNHQIVTDRLGHRHIIGWR